MKQLTGEAGRAALYALASATGEVVIALEGDRDELRALAEAGARRSHCASPAAVVIIKDATAFATSAGSLRWKRIPAQIFIDGTKADRGTVTCVAQRLSAVAPVVVAVSGPREDEEP